MKREFNRSTCLPSSLISTAFNSRARFLFPYRITQVCCLWNRVCAGVPRLWTYVLYEWRLGAAAGPPAHVLTRHLQFAGSFPLLAELRGLIQEYSKEKEVLKEAGSRLKTLVVASHQANAIIPVEMGHLEALNISDTTQEINSYHQYELDRRFNCPKLQKLQLVSSYDMKFWSRCSFPALHTVVLKLHFGLTATLLKHMTEAVPNLTRLRLQDSSYNPNDDPGTLNWHDATRVEAPNLQTLEIVHVYEVRYSFVPTYNYPFRKITLAIMALDAPELRELVLGFYEDPLDWAPYTNDQPNPSWGPRFPKLETIRFEDARGPPILFATTLRHSTKVEHVAVEYRREMLDGDGKDFVEGLVQSGPLQRLETLTAHELLLPQLSDVLKDTTLTVRVCTDVRKAKAPGLEEVMEVAPVEFTQGRHPGFRKAESSKRLPVKAKIP